MRGLAAAGLATAIGAGLVGMAVVASAVSFLGGVPAGLVANASGAEGPMQFEPATFA